MQKIVYIFLCTFFVNALAMHSASHDQKNPNVGPDPNEIIATAEPIASLALGEIYKEGYFAFLPTELKRELNLYHSYKTIEVILKLPKIYNKALETIEKLLKANQFSPFFNSLYFTYFLIDVLRKKEKAPHKQEGIARDLNTVGTKEWLLRYPDQLELLDAAEKGNSIVVKNLLDQGTNVNARDNNGWTPLMRATERGHKEVVEVLLDKSAYINAKDDNGYTALMYATMSGHKDIVELLLAHNADLNEQDNFGKTALLNPARNGYKDIVELLLLHGADINTQAKDGYTALEYATRFGHKDIVEFLLSKGAKQ